MDQASQDNELQKAIDDITKNAGGADASTDVAAELEQKIQDQMGTPPVPPIPPAGDSPAEAMPPAEGVQPIEPAGMPTEAAPQIIGSGGEVGTPEAPAVEVPAEPVAPEPLAPVAEPSVEMGGDIKQVKEAMMRDLFPIMDKVNMAAEEKFALYKSMIDETNDKSMIAGAYEVVKGMADETQRAEALLYLIQKADA